MTHKKHEIAVFIENEEMLKEARELLEKYGEEIETDGTFSLDGDPKWQFLRFDFGKWWLADICRFNKITLPQLEGILKNQ